VLRDPLGALVSRRPGQQRSVHANRLYTRRPRGRQDVCSADQRVAAAVGVADAGLFGAGGVGREAGLGGSLAKPHDRGGTGLAVPVVGRAATEGRLQRDEVAGLEVTADADGSLVGGEDEAAPVNRDLAGGDVGGAGGGGDDGQGGHGSTVLARQGPVKRYQKHRIEKDRRVGSSPCGPLS